MHTDAVGQLGDIPDVICMGGWWPMDHHEFLHGSHKNAGCRGLSDTDAIIDEGRLLRGKLGLSDGTLLIRDQTRMKCVVVR